MRENEPAVVMTSVAKSYAGRAAPVPVFGDANLTVQRGEMLAVAGRNGVGKSTLIRLIAGLLLPDAGTVRVVDARGALVDPARNPGTVSAVFDGSRGLYWRMTVAENLGYLARLDGMRADDALRAAQPWLERLGLAAKRDELVQTLSKGTQQKVSIVRALTLSKRVLLFDEPTTLLDDESSCQLAEILRERCREGAAVVIATHDREFMANTGARQIVIDAPGLLRRVLTETDSVVAASTVSTGASDPSEDAVALLR